jgi:hypothetical protein
MLEMVAIVRPLEAGDDPRRGSAINGFTVSPAAISDGDPSTFRAEEAR